MSVDIALPLDFFVFQASKEILIYNSGLSCFENENGSHIYPDADHFLTYKGVQIPLSQDCQWILFYHGGLYIEKREGPLFFLVIENHQWQDPNLTTLEKILYKWSQDE